MSRAAIFAFALLSLVAACKSPSGTAQNEVEVRVSSNVTWPKVDGIDKYTLRSYPETFAAIVSDTPMPVLLPKGITFSDPMLIAQGEYYSFSGRALVNGQPDANYTVHATKLAHEYPGTKLAEATVPMRGTKGYITINEGIRVASWSENGVAYSVDIECTREDDVQCSHEAHIIGVVNNLAYVGGRGR